MQKSVSRLKIYFWIYWKVQKGFKFVVKALEWGEKEKTRTTGATCVRWKRKLLEGVQGHAPWKKFEIWASY